MAIFIYMDNHQMTIDQLTSQIYRSASPSDAKKIDPLTLLAIASLVVNIIRAIQWCYTKPADAKTMMEKPGPLEKVKLRQIIREKIRDNHEDLTPRQFRERVREAIEELGTKVSVEDVEKLYKEAEERDAKT
jgi:hypothetical protein